MIYKLPRVAYISKITDAIHEFTDMPISQIQEVLQWGNGPELNIIQLDNYKPGETDSNTVGYFDKDFPNKILLDIDHANFLE